MTTKCSLSEIASNPRLPSPRPVALQVLEKAGRPDCSMSDLARLLQMDPALSSHLLKTANSALFSLPRAVTTIERALMLLGTKAVRSVVLGLSLTALQRRIVLEPHLTDFWRTSVAGAVFAHELAVRLKRSDPEEDLVAGLLRDIGSLILVQVLPQEYEAVLAALTSEPAERQCELETAALGIDHAEVGAFVLAKWHLPPEITEAIRFHHRPDQAFDKQQERAHLLYLATQYAQLHVTPDCAGLRHELLQLARTWFGIDSNTLESLLRPIEKKARALAEVLEVDTRQVRDQSELAIAAIEELTQLVSEGSVENLVARREKELATKEKLSWQRKARRLRHDAVRDSLTGAYNRAFFEEALDCEMRRASRRRSALGLMFIDVDDFKTINDRFGHPFGDFVLREVIGVLRKEVRSGDIVSRFGGDEFCIIVPDATESALQALSERLLSRLKNMTISDGEQSARVKLSIGAVVCDVHDTKHTSEHVLAAADQAMYQAKTRGKNQVSIATLATAPDTSEGDDTIDFGFTIDGAQISAESSASSHS
jgi:diguanylate cyclase (GGDEF)-like protein